ncbi:MAG: arsenate reductase ArsC [Candidatus Margulisiibacteriota bacterium]
MKKKKVLFVCTFNSVRSQMAEGLLTQMKGDEYHVYSAGVEAVGVNPYAIAVMAEMGINITHHHSKTVEEVKEKEFDIVVTVCDNARESCPEIPAKKVIHKNFHNPGTSSMSPAETLQNYRKIRNEIKEWLEKTF